MIITIDGPAGSGKSTICNNICKKDKDIMYINTGNFYRLITYKCIQKKINYYNEDDIIKFLQKYKIKLEKNGLLYFNGEYISQEKLKNNNIAQLTSQYISKYIKIRDYITKQLKQNIKLNLSNKKIILDGRDMGTYVFPEAEYKFFISSDLHKRAYRRYKEFIMMEEKYDYNYILKSLIKRDLNDIKRKYHPLVIHKDAIIIDTTKLDIDMVVNKIFNIIK